LIIDNNTKEQIFSSDTYRKSYDNFQYDLGDTVGAAFGDSFMHNPAPALWRLAKGLFSEKADEITAEDAQAKYGLNGALKFDTPVSDTYARGMMETKIKEMRNQQILEKGKKGFVAETAKFGAGLGASVVDPINIASAFIPTGRILSAVGMAKLGASKTLGATVSKGAISGSVGAAVIEPLPLYSAKQYQLDYDMTDSLMNIVFGGVIGGGAHGVGHFFSGRAEARAVEQSLKDMTFDRQSEVFTKNLDAFFDDKLPKLADDFIKDAKQGLRADHLSDAEFLRAIPEVMESKWSEAVRIKQIFDAKDIIESTDQTLISWLKKRGGLNDPTGELRSYLKTGGRGQAQVGLVTNKTGDLYQPDKVLREAQEAGFFPKDRLDDPDALTVSDLFEAINNEMLGLGRVKTNKRTSAKDDLRMNGFDDDMTVSQIFDELAARDFESRQSAEADVFNEAFPDHHVFDDTREDMFLEPDFDFQNPVELTDIEKQIADLGLEVKNTLENMEPSSKADYEETLKEINEELSIAQTLKDDLSNLASCVWFK
jgi:hypothetical protein